MAEQRYKGVLAVISDGRTVKEVAGDWGVSRQTLHAWLARYEAAGLEGLGNRSFRPLHCPHQMPVEIEIAVLEMRRSKPYWGARRLVLELARKGIQPLPSESAVYRSLVRAGVIDPKRRQRRQEHFKRWERATPMDLWQLDVVGGFHLADGSTANGVVSVGYQQVCIGAQYAGKASDVLVKEGLLQFWVDGQLTKTVARATQGVIRKKHADGQAPRQS